MKHISLGIIAIAFCTKLFCQISASKNHSGKLLTPIEQIQTIEDVDSFLIKYTDSLYNIKILPVKPTSAFRIRLKEIQDYFIDSLKISPFLKEDFDKDGRTDLLINTIWRLRPSGFIILDKGHGRYLLKTFIDNQGNRMNMAFIKPGKIDGKQCINYFLVDLNRLFDGIPFMEVNETFKTGFVSEQNLVYKFDEFIEFNRRPSSLSFQKIDYQRGGIFEEYIHYSLQIQNDRKVYLRVEGENKYLNDSKTIGTYNSKLSRKEISILKKLMGYINLSGLKNKYDVKQADVPWAVIRLTGKKFETLRIMDRGLSGTFGLEVLHQYFDKLYRSLNWEQENEPVSWLK